MFNKILIANRGEIASRIIRTARRMGVGTVAVYTDADAESLHVREADEAVCIGEGPVSSSYLNGPLILAAAAGTGAEAVHPGYGFLSENVAFAASCQDAGLTWIGPDPVHLRRFGQKHEARALAASLGVPLLAGTDLLATAEEAVGAAAEIGYPVLLKATAGGGGIGMQRCDDDATLVTAFESVTRLAAQNFGEAGVFLERFVRRARHVEVQIFGARGTVVVLGLRDCSAQRRHQKVIEEAPPIGLSDDLTTALSEWAVGLAGAVGYRSAGTVEFVVDAERGDAAFLEVNTRLQVEHGVTELITGLDLVEWMLREAAGELDLAVAAASAGRGAAIEVRLYAEDPAHGNRPQTGELVRVSFPEDTRIDTWVETGTEVTPFYDPLLAKVLVTAPDRAAAVAAMVRALDAVRLDGMATNLGLLRDAVSSAAFLEGAYPTTFLDGLTTPAAGVEVIVAGLQTSVQDHPGRLGYWAVGVPPSGPMDDLSFRLANEVVGNDRRAAGLEMVLVGPTLRFHQAAVVAAAGAAFDVRVDGEPVPLWTAVAVPAGALLSCGSPGGAGSRAYLAVRGGFDVPEYLGSRSTFTLGGFGGHRGRALMAGDVIGIAMTAGSSGAQVGDTIPASQRPEMTHDWELGVVDGPHGAPDFFTPAGIEGFYAAAWEVHHQSDRTGVRLIGPAPEWARADGGEAGLHPSNIHDNTYAIGTVDFTGDMPVILGPDGPSLGGFVCPVTVLTSERWKIGQLTAGDRVRFVRRDEPSAPDSARGGSAKRAPSSSPVLYRRESTAAAPAVTYRRAGDCCVLIEYGPNVLDLRLRFRVHALMEALDGEAGIVELAPGIRSLQVRFEPTVLSIGRLVDLLADVEDRLPDPSDLVVPSRVVHLPLSWDDPATRLAIERYTQVVRDDAPWCPWNIEFIRRINGLESVDDVRRIVFDASYLVLGLGDVYLGAPVATPLDPRHRLVTTKYNPARTWTPENAVGIGGAYLCVYGMEGPGGYQFVGRTVQMWSRHRVTPEFPGERRWLLRFFDQLRFHPVSAEELLVLRRDFAAGRHRLDITETALSLADYERFLVDEAETISAFKAGQQAAFDAERARWVASGEMTRAAATPAPVSTADGDGGAVPDGATAVSTPVHGVVARVAAVGDAVTAGDAVFVVEAMKTETAVSSPAGGTVTDVRCSVGQVVTPGRPLVVVSP